VSIAKDWKLKLRYGKLKTPYQHFTIIVPVIINEFIEDFSAQPGKAYAGIKMWATDIDEAIDLTCSLAKHTGFEITGKIEVHKTDPVQPPGNNPNAYDINFSYYQE
jgi:hypothetical protein